MIDVLPVFPDLNHSLIQFLKGLKPADWGRATVCSQWTVKDIAAHLLDTLLRRLSIGRDAYSEKPGNNFKNDQQLLTFLNTLNADWVKAYKRVSPEILIEMLTIYQQQFHDYLQGLDPQGPAIFPVAWAGEEFSQNWFDVAREYTERWLHQQQMRQAMNDQELLQPRFYSPFLQTVMLGLPHAYAKADAPPGSTVKVEIVGAAGGNWVIKKEQNAWVICESIIHEPDAIVYIDQQIAWLLFSKGVKLNEAGQYYQLKGNTDLGVHALSMVTVMA